MYFRLFFVMIELRISYSIQKCILYYVIDLYCLQKSPLILNSFDVWNVTEADVFSEKAFIRWKKLGYTSIFKVFYPDNLSRFLRTLEGLLSLILILWFQGIFATFWNFLRKFSVERAEILLYYASVNRLIFFSRSLRDVRREVRFKEALQKERVLRLRKNFWV